MTEFGAPWSHISAAAAEDIVVHPRSFGVNPFEATARAPNDASPGVSGVVPKVRGPSPSGAQSGPQQASAPSRPESSASNPAAWNWVIASRSIKSGTVRAAAFAPNGERAIAAGPSGVARWQRGVWVQTPIAKIDPRAVRGAAWLRDGDALLFGERALVAKVSATGNVDVWHVPDRDVTFLGAFVEDGIVTLVGDRPYRGTAPRSVRGVTSGVIAQFTGDRLTLLSESAACTRFTSVTRLASGSLVGCGEWGAIVRLEMGVAEFVRSICAGHLFAIERLANGGAVTVGAGGHALSLSAKLESQLEAVQTTRDLLTLAVSDDGTSWAGSAQARILRRSGGNWVRMSGELGITPNVVEVWASARTVRAVCDDGAVIEGQLT